MNKIQIFEHEQFGKVRTVVIDGEPWFVGKDIADCLGYSNSSKAVMVHVDDEDKKSAMLPNSQNGNSVGKFTLINESGIYSLIMSSKLPSAKEFKRWVTSVILPSIRRTGGYVGDADMFVENYLPFADEPIKQLFCLQMEVIGQLNDRIRHDEPLVNFAKQVADTSNCINVETFAKLAFGKNSNFGRNNMFKWLKKRKYLTFNNIPYQKYIDAGYFVVKETFFIKNGKKKTYQQTLVTGKGQVYLMSKLREEFDI